MVKSETYLDFANAAGVAGLPQAICLVLFVAGRDHLSGRRGHHSRVSQRVACMLGLLLQHVAQVFDLGVHVLAILLDALRATDGAIQGREGGWIGRLRRRRVNGRIVRFLGAWRWGVLGRH